MLKFTESLYPQWRIGRRLLPPKAHATLGKAPVGHSVIVSRTLWKLCLLSYEGASTWASLEARDAALKTKEGLACIDDSKNYVKKLAKVYLRSGDMSGGSLIS